MALLIARASRPRDVEALIVPSSAQPGRPSIRARDGHDLRGALARAGYLPGDRVLIVPALVEADELEAARAAAVAP